MLPTSDLNNLKIRKMSIRDLAVIQELEKSLGLSHWSYEDYLQEIGRPNSVNIVAELSGDPIGFLIGRLIMISREAELYNIGISRNYMRRGIGNLLIKQFINDCGISKIENIWLDVRQSNNIAINFYTKKGFQIVGERKNFYHNPAENSFLLKLQLGKFTEI